MVPIIFSPYLLIEVPLYLLIFNSPIIRQCQLNNKQNLCKMVNEHTKKIKHTKINYLRFNLENST